MSLTTALSTERKLGTTHQVFIAAACALLVFTACGINFAYGVFQEHYETVGGPFTKATPGQISIIGTLSSSVMMMGAPAVNWLSKSHGPQAAVTASGTLFAVSGMLASRGSRLWHFQLAQGLVQGCAASLAYIIAVTIAPRAFDTKRGLAMGIVTSGTGLGGVIWAPLLRHSVTVSGFRFTLVFAGLLAANLVFFAALAFSTFESVSEDLSPGPRSSLGDTTLTTKHKPRVVLLHILASGLQAAAYFTPLYFMSSLARSLHFSETSGANIIALCNLCNCLGKILIGYAADRMGTMKLLWITTAVSALACFGVVIFTQAPIPLKVQRATLLLYAAIYGSSAGAYVALLPTALIEQLGAHGFVRANGVVYMFRGLGALLGTFIAGTLMVTQGVAQVHLPTDFTQTFVFVGASLTAAAALLVWIAAVEATGERTSMR